MREVIWVVVEGGQPEVGYTFHLDKGSSAVSISDRKRHNSQDMLRQLLAKVWHHTYPH